MLEETIHISTISASAAREHLADLEAERRLAVRCGVAAIESYMDDLDQEFELWRHEFVTAAVAEIATLRGELFGINAG